jgi:hypothetical protein
MHADLIWLAENVSEWGGTYDFKHIFLEDGREKYYSNPESEVYKTFTRAQWQAARDELFTQRAAQRQRPKIKTQVTAWHAAEDEILASEMSGAEPCPEDPFASPEEDEAWAEAEKRMHAIGQNGGTGEHYESPASKYHVQIKGHWVDVYDILTAYSVTNPADAHAIKKMLCPGQRGAKDGIQDRREAIASLERAIELEQGR